MPTPYEARTIIERNLATIPRHYDIQIAFFGGSFTCLPLETQKAYLQVAQPFIENKLVSGIRISTRPDYIDDDILKMLKSFHVTDIELGAQSTNDTVLKRSGRGHNKKAIIDASKKINAHGFQLGLQMMLGLPGDTFETALQTAQDIIAFGAKTTRIYPTLVVADTPLAKLYEQGKYNPLTLSQAVAWTTEIYTFFVKNNIIVLKVGLHPNKDFTSNKYLLAGPFHQSFKELVLSNIWHNNFKYLLEKIPTSKNITIFVPHNEINNAIGYNSQNRNELLKIYKNVTFRIDSALQDYEFTYCNN